MPSQHAKICVCDQQLLWFSVAAEVPATLSEGGGLNAEVGVSAGDVVFFLKGELGIVFVNVVFGDGIRQTSDDEEVSVAHCDAAGTMDNLRNRVAGQFSEAGGVIGKDPRVGIAGRVIEFPEVDGDEDLAVVMAQVAMMIGDGHGLQYFPLQICFDESGGEGPEH